MYKLDIVELCKKFISVSGKNRVNMLDDSSSEEYGGIWSEYAGGVIVVVYPDLTRIYLSFGQAP